MSPYINKFLIMFHNILNKSTIDSKETYLKLIKTLYLKYIPIVFLKVLDQIVVVARHYTRLCTKFVSEKCNLALLKGHFEI